MVFALTIDEKTGRLEWRIALPILPAIAAGFYAAYSREKENVRLTEVRLEKEDAWISLANEILIQTDVIKAYNKQEMIAKDFKTVYEEFYVHHRKHRKYEMGTGWKCHW